MHKIKKIIKDLYPFDYSVVSEGNDKSLAVFKKYLNFKVHNFKSGYEVNGWKIPDLNIIKKAKLFHKKKLILDAKISPFSLVKLSKNFKGYVDYNELLNHLFFSKAISKAIPYGWFGLYRPKERNWGFCVNKIFMNKIKNKKKFYVDIKTHKKKSFMRVLDYHIKGKSEKTIIINAHNCHPYQANDDISGCAVGISFFQYLNSIKSQLNYSYRLIIAPELYGPIFLMKKEKKSFKNCIGAILLKSVANNSKLKLQKSFNGKTLLDKSAQLLLKKYKFSKEGEFRTVYGNDETVFEAPGYNIPTISITRFPFKEYHTNYDTPKICFENKALETLNVLKDIHFDLEKNFTYETKFKGLISLSNPKYDLYKPAEAPGLDKIKYNKINKNWNLFMNSIPMYGNKKTTLLELGIKFNLDVKEIYNYLLLWEKKKLIKLSLKKNLFINDN